MDIKKYKKLVLISMIVYQTLLYGCWDSTEIEKRGYVLGVAIDTPEKESFNSDSLEYSQQESKGKLYEYTIQLPIIANSKNRPTGQSGGSSNKERQANTTIVSNTFFDASREFATQMDYEPFYPHLNSIVINEDVASEDVSKIFDVFLRHFNMRRRIKVFITPEKAKEVLDVVPMIDDYSSQYLNSLPNNRKKTSRLLHKSDLGKIAEAIHENRPFILPKVISDKNNIIKNAGCAVFKDNKMVGWLDEVKTNYLKWITDAAVGGIISLNIPEYEEYPMVLEIKKVKAKQRPVVDNGNLKMNLDIKSTLNLGELNIPNRDKVIDSDFIKEIEAISENKIKDEIKKTISYVQENYGADIFLFGVNVHRYAPDTWDKVKDDWNQHFRYLEVQVNVKVKIIQFGLTK